MSFPVSIDDVREALGRIDGSIVHTPALLAAAISERSGAEVWLKLESRQRTGSFKDRGAANRMLTLSERERAAGVIAMSAGNHAQAVAYQAMRLGIPATIVMPVTTPFTKMRRTEQYGARIFLEGDTLADCGERTSALAAEHGYTLIHPYDDPAVLAGQGTAALEFLADAPALDALLIPVGGGGLIAGCSLVAKHLNPDIEILGVEAEAFPSLARIRAGLEPKYGRQTVAEGIAVKTIGRLPLVITEALVSDVLLASEQSIERAVHLLLEEEKLLAEGAGAAAVAALLDDPERFRGKRVGIVISGGNIDTGLLANVINRARLREGRVVRMRVEIDDRPGILADVARIIGECGANVLDVTHQRLLYDVPSKNAELDITFETRSPADVERIAERLHGARYTTALLESTSRSSHLETH